MLSEHGTALIVNIQSLVFIFLTFQFLSYYFIKSLSLRFSFPFGRRRLLFPGSSEPTHLSNHSESCARVTVFAASIALTMSLSLTSQQFGVVGCGVCPTSAPPPPVKGWLPTLCCYCLKLNRAQFAKFLVTRNVYSKVILGHVPIFIFLLFLFLSYGLNGSACNLLSSLIKA